MNVVNLTPHDVRIVNEAGEVVKIYPKTGQVARIDSKQVSNGDIDGVPCVKTAFTAPIDLPAPVDGTIYIVSLVTAQNCPRPDLVAPDTGPGSVVRDEAGQIIGVKRFTVYS